MQGAIALSDFNFVGNRFHGQLLFNGEFGSLAIWLYVNLSNSFGKNLPRKTVNFPSVKVRIKLRFLLSTALAMRVATSSEVIIPVSFLGVSPCWVPLAVSAV